MPPPVPAVTACETSSASWSENRRYTRRFIRRSGGESSLLVVPGWVTQVPPLHSAVYAATAIAVGPVNVELAGVAKSTWNFQTWSALVSSATIVLGSPDGGRVV